jgi:hypothetical protein
MTKVVVYVEISELLDLNIDVIQLTENWYVDLLKRFKFQSSKSLISFLDKYETEVIDKIPYTKTKLLEQLEKQNYIAPFKDEDFTPDDNSILSPQDILDIAVKYEAITEKNIQDYLFKNTKEYTYHAEIKDI